MGAKLGSGRRAAIIADINVTPLCDILLVLLIIFMVASTYIVSQAIKVELPKAKSSDGTSQGPATLTILEDGTIRWNGDAIEEASVSTAIEDAVAHDPAMELVISADRAVSHGRVVTFIDHAKLAGVVRFAINVEQK